MTATKVDDEDLQLLKEAALHYLDQTSQLESIKQKCQEYSGNKENALAGVYFFLIDVDPSLLQDSLNDVVLHNPKVAKRVFQQVCFTAVQCLSLLPEDVKSSQVIVNLKVTHLPPFQSYRIKPHDLPACKFDSRFYQFDGVVVSMTTPTEYSQVAKYRCPLSQCNGATDNQYIRLHTAGAKETHTIRKDFHCVYCGSTLIEDVNFRILGEKLVVEMIDKSALSSNNGTQTYTSGVYNQSMTVFLRDELMHGIEMGEQYTVIGIPIKMVSAAKVSVSFEANNIFQFNSLLSSSLKCHQIPASIHDLYKDSMCSPWSFSASLAYLYGSDIVPPGAYHKLKFILLLSLVDSLDTTKGKVGRLNLYVTGRDTLVIDRLLRYGGSLAERTVQHSSGLPLTATINKDDHGTGACSIDGGSVLLAHNGLCLLGDVAKFKKDAIEKLYHVMETSKVMAEIPKKFADQSVQQLMMPVKCTIWAYGESKANRTSLDVFAPLEPSKSKTSLLEECFSLTLSCSSADWAKDDYAEQCLIHQTLLQGIGGEEKQESQCLLDKDDLQQFLRYVSHIQVDLSPAATRLIKGYFVASRRVRSSGVHGTAFPQAALQTLSQISKVHARLSLRQEVLEQDAVLAIMLYEEIITQRFGYSVLSLQPRLHFKDDNISAYIGPENDAYMQQFHVQLIRFCSSHAPDFDVFESES